MKSSCLCKQIRARFTGSNLEGFKVFNFVREVYHVSVYYTFVYEYCKIGKDKEPIYMSFGVYRRGE